MDSDEPEAHVGEAQDALAIATPRTHLVLTVHGIRTYGEWQERLGKLLENSTSQQDGTTWDVRNYRYGFFTVFSFLVPWLRGLAVKQFRNHLIAILEEGHFERIDIIAHSLGTFLTIKGLSGLAPTVKANVNTVILCGSVLSPDSDLSQLIGPGRRIGRLINDCGTKDGILLLTLMIIGVGMGGRRGLHGFEGRSLTNRYFELGHSGYFEPVAGAPDVFIQKWWLPLLLYEKPVIPGPPRPSSAPLSERFWRTLGENGSASTGLFYGVLLTLIFGTIGTLWREAERERFATLQQSVRGQAALSQRLFDTGKSDEAMKELKNAAVLTKGYSLQAYFPELLGALRTINAEYNVIARLKRKNNSNIVAANFDKTSTRLVTGSW